MFGGAKPELSLHYDPSQAMALQVVRGLLAQHVMQTVAQSLFSAAGQTFDELRERALRNPALPDQRRRELTEMFDSIARVQGSATPSGSTGTSGNAPAFGLPYSTREEEASARPEVKYNRLRSDAFVGALGW